MFIWYQSFTVTLPADIPANLDHQLRFRLRQGDYTGWPHSFYIDNITVSELTSTLVTGLQPDVVEYHDYDPFGMLINQRTRSESGGYRYGFNGKEKDDEIKGIDGSSLNYTFRMHDPRVGRFFAVDLLFKAFPWNSAYAFSENRVIDSGELKGLERYYAADGKFVHQIGKSEEVRILDKGVDGKLIQTATNPKLALEKRKKAEKQLLEKSFHGYANVDAAASNWAYNNNDKSKVLDIEFGANINKVKISTKRIQGVTDGSGYVAILGETVKGYPKDGTDYGLDAGKILDNAKKTPGKFSAIVHAHSNGSDNFSGYEGDAQISRDSNLFS